MSNNDKVCLLCPSYINKKEENEVAQLKCGHIFCWTCLDSYIQDHLDKRIKCPHESCQRFIPDGVIRKTLSAENILKYENVCLEGIQKSHRCLLPQCNAIVFYADSNIQYACQLCSLYNCLVCNAAHNFSSCAKYQAMSSARKQDCCNRELDRAKEVLKGIQRQEMRLCLLDEDNQDLLINNYAFSCWLCGTTVAKGHGVRLRDCSHTFCRSCVTEHIVTCTQIPVKCPIGCRSTISDREILSLLNETQMTDYQRKYNTLMKRKTNNYFQCKYPDCDSIYHYTELPDTFRCVKCNHDNCVKCSAVHDQETCEEYRQKTENNSDAIFIEENIKLKLMMKCPDCGHLLRKTKGCNWIRCDKCFVELCWIRQMYRWGPRGRGDISGGCGCGIRGTFCHPDCRGCIPDL